MKFRGGVAALICALALAASPTFADGLSQRAGRAGNATVTYSAEQSCRVICRAPKPVLERAEDLLAYALDIPLAILSPFTCPIVAPIWDSFEQGPERTFQEASVEKMTSDAPAHPVDSLSWPEKCRIYYGRVVDLAAVCGLLVPDPDTEIGHFAYSEYIFTGKELDTALQRALKDYRQRFPKMLALRREEQNLEFSGAVRDYIQSEDSNKVQDLIQVGASYKVWPTGTSFTLTYPWDLSGREMQVRFRPDLTDFMKRRIINILRAAGKLKNPRLFDDPAGVGTG